ncbi:MAG TPA: uridine kinase [Bacteroidota bacterium]|nr:uridine kinase [Bacteroidota bacterium]
MQSLIIGIAGGTGSGKTTVTSKVLKSLEQERIVVIQHDSYYRDLGAYHGLTPDKINFDHPDSLETDLLIQHLSKLRDGVPIEQPIYNFTTHQRLKETRTVEAKEIIIVEGILIFVEKALRDLMDIKIFLDTDADERLIRRIRRDILERGRSVDSVMTQYMNTVKPMHLEFVEPSKHWADIIIPRGAENTVAIDMVVTKIKSMFNQKVGAMN